MWFFISKLELFFAQDGSSAILSADATGISRGN
jgi:hypothetical protein